MNEEQFDKTHERIYTRDKTIIGIVLFIILLATTAYIVTFTAEQRWRDRKMALISTLIARDGNEEVEKSLNATIESLRETIKYNEESIAAQKEIITLLDERLNIYKRLQPFADRVYSNLSDDTKRQQPGDYYQLRNDKQREEDRKNVQEVIEKTKSPSR